MISGEDFFVDIYGYPGRITNDESRISIVRGKLRNVCTALKGRNNLAQGEER
ncbi:MAG: hypothetical protein WD824_27270 [Cyclobacteriaceae bacterium]